MNKIRYWKKQLYLVILLYVETEKNTNSNVFRRAFNMWCEINDYLFRLEAKKE